jgi:hypothetical protein
VKKHGGKEQQQLRGRGEHLAHHSDQDLNGEDENDARNAKIDVSTLFHNPSLL